METTIDFINNLDVLTLSVSGIALVGIIAFIITAKIAKKRKSANNEAQERIDDLEMIVAALQTEVDQHTHSVQTLQRDERRAKAKKKAPKMKAQKDTAIDAPKKRGRKPKKA